MLDHVPESVCFVILDKMYAKQTKIGVGPSLLRRGAQFEAQNVHLLFWKTLICNKSRLLKAMLTKSQSHDIYVFKLLKNKNFNCTRF